MFNKLSATVLFFLATAFAFANGNAELSGGQKIYWILGEADSNHDMLLERFYLPTSLAALIWAEFNVSDDGISFESRAGYRVLSKRLLSTEQLGTFTLYAYALNIEIISPQKPPPPASDASEISVRFRYDTTQTVRIAAQPLQQALIEAIRSSGKQSGLARVTELRYLGKARFQATVQVH